MMAKADFTKIHGKFFPPSKSKYKHFVVSSEGKSLIVDMDDFEQRTRMFVFEIDGLNLSPDVADYYVTVETVSKGNKSVVSEKFKAKHGWFRTM